MYIIWERQEIILLIIYKFWQWINYTLLNYYYIKSPQIYDRYHIFKEWGFGHCGSEVHGLDRSEIDLLQEVLEVIDELERKYKNTCQELLEWWCFSNKSLRILEV